MSRLPEGGGGKVFQEGRPEQVMTRDNLDWLYQIPIDVAALPDGRRMIVAGAGGGN